MIAIGGYDIAMTYEAASVTETVIGIDRMNCPMIPVERIRE